MADSELVPGSGYISDDSDFYGTVKIRSKLDACGKSVDTMQLIRYWMKNKVAFPTALATPLGSVPQFLYNRLEGDLSARQLGETAGEFLKRLPPRTTSSLDVGPWIWVTCPIIKGKGKNPDLGHFPEPESPSGDVLGRAGALLHQYEGEQERIKSLNPDAVQSTITRKLSPLREKLKNDLLDLAVEGNTTSGKWMLFPKPDDVNRIWKIIAEAVIDGRLGDTAKVATADGTESDRLICVYTKDFSDLDDVRRVLNELVELGLAPRTGQGRPIYYKCDFYTYLDLGSNNPYGVEASLYCSKDLLGMAGPIKQKQQTTAQADSKRKQQTLTDMMGGKKKRKTEE